MVIKDKDGNKKTQIEQVLKLWKNHFEMHLNTEFLHDPNVLDEIPEPVNSTDETFTITEEDIRNAIKTLNTRKSPGSDSITAEVLKAGGEKVVNILSKIFQKVLHEK